jgi:hypothetical protein
MDILEKFSANILLNTGKGKTYPLGPFDTYADAINAAVEEAGREEDVISFTIDKKFVITD